jgi:hypothetical protein
MSEVDKKVNEWIIKADHDLGTAKLIYLHIPDYCVSLSASNREIYKIDA